MDKRITSALLVAGTCIGGGTIALPIVLAKIGIIPSILIIFLMAIELPPVSYRGRVEPQV